MGCCVSTPSLSPYPTQQGNSSSRAITSSQPQSHSALPRPSTHASSHSNRPPQPHREPQPLSVPINKPLKAHVWTSTNRLWTRSELDREREEFFDTRVTGRQEIWQTLRTALEVLWTGGDAMDHDGGMATAQQILDATGMTVPTGDLARGAYDSLGAFYPLPEYIVSDPTNLVIENVVEDEVSKGDVRDKSGNASEEVDEDEVLRRREEKGKAVLNPNDEITIKARRSDGVSKDLVITAGKADSVRLLTRRFLEEGGIAPPKRIRLVYMGKILLENQSLTAQGWKDDHILNAMVFPG